MKNFLLAATLLTAAYAAVAHSLAPSYPDCRIEEKAATAFRTNRATDILRVTIVGAPCYKGQLTIEITAQDGVSLYAYAAEFKRHTAVQWDEADLPQIAAELAKRIVSSAHDRTSAELPPWLPKEEYYEQYYETIEIPKNRYEALRRENRPLFTHPTHYEEWQTVVFDPATATSLIILTGGV